MRSHRDRSAGRTRDRTVTEPRDVDTPGPGESPTTVRRTASGRPPRRRPAPVELLPTAVAARTGRQRRPDDGERGRLVEVSTSFGDRPLAPAPRRYRRSPGRRIRRRRRGCRVRIAGGEPARVDDRCRRLGEAVSERPVGHVAPDRDDPVFRLVGARVGLSLPAAGGGVADERGRERRPFHVPNGWPRRYRVGDRSGRGSGGVRLRIEG